MLKIDNYDVNRVSLRLEDARLIRDELNSLNEIEKWIKMEQDERDMTGLIKIPE